LAVPHMSKLKTDYLLQEDTLHLAAGEDEGTPEGEELCENR
jgi:hypothetical protein